MFKFIKFLSYILLIAIQLKCFDVSAQVWPFGKELKFPWQTISGIWHGENGESSINFSFNIGSSDGVYFDEVVVTQISSRNNVPLAKGTVVIENDVGSGMMQTTNGEHNYFITIRLAQKKNATKPTDKKYTVVTVESLPGESPGWFYIFEMEKTSDYIDQMVNGINKKINTCSNNK